MSQEHDRIVLLKSVGARVRALRLEAGLTVKEFADRASLSARFVHQIEGGAGNVSIVGLARAAAALDRSLSELIPPAEEDHSPAAQAWRYLSEASREELRDFELWLAERNGARHASRFVALIGLRGAGKSTVGPMLARKLKTEFVELDKWVEEAADMSLAEVFATHGEAYYRRLERESIQRVLSRSSGCILAPGGSIVSDAESWEFVKRRCFTVWLHATPEEFMRRMRRQGDLRPMQGRPSAMDELKALLGRREPLYNESQMKIKTTNQSPSAIVAKIVKAVNEQL
jgi:XRE family transcriptional regulator, aerobic/anaerobic benzoate catabolism transcriptional regulator